MLSKLFSYSSWCEIKIIQKQEILPVHSKVSSWTWCLQPSTWSLPDPQTIHEYLLEWEVRTYDKENVSDLVNIHVFDLSPDMQPGVLHPLPSHCINLERLRQSYFFLGEAEEAKSPRYHQYLLIGCWCGQEVLLLVCELVLVEGGHSPFLILKMLSDLRKRCFHCKWDQPLHQYCPLRRVEPAWWCCETEPGCPDSHTLPA